VESKGKSRKVNGWVVVLGLIVVFGMAASLNNGNSGQSAPPNKSDATATSSDAASSSAAASSGPRKPHRWEFEQSVRDNLKDPDSAKFTDELIVQQDNGFYVMCGNVNAKNGFGGYTGKTPFVAAGALVIIRSPETEKTFVDVWNKMCADRPAEDAK
jgi:hypothetical protein